MMTIHQVDIELNIRRHLNDLYAVRLIAHQSNQDTELASVIIPFNETPLLAESLDADAYGHVLTDMLFADPELRQGWAQAMGYHQGNKTSFRVRLWLDETVDVLHSIHWETLRDPLTSIPLSQDERVIFSRYLSSHDLTDLQAPYHPDLHAVVAVANPHNLKTFNLAEVKVDQEVECARTGLGDIQTTILAQGHSAQRPTLVAIADALRAGANILYLVCHGMLKKDTGQSYLWLEKDDGTADQVTGEMLAQTLAKLAHRPHLVILAACESAGVSHSDRAFTAVGPRLAHAGIAAVIAMLGRIPMQTVAQLMPRFFSELRRHGQIDLALAAARAALQHEFSWWMPVLFLRLRNGQIWYAAELQAHRAQFRTWLLRQHTLVRPTNLDQITNGLLAYLSTADLNWGEFESLDALVEAIYTIDTTSDAIKSLTRLLEDVLPQPIPWSRVAELQQILRGVKVYREDLVPLFYRNAPRQITARVSEDRDVSAILADMVRLLAKVPVDLHEQTHPLLKFVQDLVDGYSQNPSAKTISALKTWNESVSKQIGIALKAVAPMATMANQSYLLVEIRPPYPLIDINPEDLATAVFYIDAWVTTDPVVGATTPIHIRSRKAEYTRETLPEGVQEIIQDSKPHWQKNGELTIEFFLPLLLLLTDVDEWKIKTFLQRTKPIGLEYRVVTRVLERVWSYTKDELWHPWQAKWERMRRISNAKIIDAVEWADRLEVCEPDVLYAMLKNDQKVGLIQTLTASFDTGLSDTHLTEMLISTIQAGIPVGLFLRRSTQPPTQARQMLESMLQACTFGEFPKLVYEQRRLAVVEQDLHHCGRHLTLLWDDPNRRPPDIEYSVP